MVYDVNAATIDGLIDAGIIDFNPLTGEGKKGIDTKTPDYPMDDYNGKSSSTVKKVAKYGIATALLAAAIYGGYKLLSKGKGVQPPISFAELKTKIGANLGKAKDWITGIFHKNPAAPATPPATPPVA